MDQSENIIGEWGVMLFLIFTGKIQGFAESGHTYPLWGLAKSWYPPPRKFFNCSITLVLLCFKWGRGWAGLLSTCLDVAVSLSLVLVSSSLLLVFGKIWMPFPFRRLNKSGRRMATSGFPPPSPPNIVCWPAPTCVACWYLTWSVSEEVVWEGHCHFHCVAGDL